KVYLSIKQNKLVAELSIDLITCIIEFDNSWIILNNVLLVTEGTCAPGGVDS
ncbi:hypothetical protein ACJX0J_018086, partial [Zea mays]